MKVTIYGYKESFLFAPSVKVYLGDRCLGEVKPKGVLVLEDVEEDSVLRFVPSGFLIRSTECIVSGSAIVLSVSRMSGRLEALATDHVDEAMQKDGMLVMKRRCVVIVSVLILMAIALCSRVDCPAYGCWVGRVKCHRCHGVGLVEDVSGNYSVDCPVCRRRGLPPWKNCENCKGRRYVSFLAKAFGHTVHNEVYPNVTDVPYSPSFRGEHEWRCSYCKEKCVASTRYDFKEGYCLKCGHPRGSHR